MQNNTNTAGLQFTSIKTYLAAAIFVAGNIILPQLLHTIPQAGATWLPIYFFTLIGSCFYGWRVGLLTAIASPLVNSLCFGMPLLAALPAILFKSVVLAVVAGCIWKRAEKLGLLSLLTIVLSYQVIGTLGEWLMTGSFFVASQDFRIGIPGMVIQVFGGWLLLNILMRRKS